MQETDLISMKSDSKQWHLDIAYKKRKQSDSVEIQAQLREDITKEVNKKLEITQPFVKLTRLNPFIGDLVLQINFSFSTMAGIDFIDRLDDDSLHLVFDQFHAPKHFIPFGQGEKSIFVSYMYVILN